MADGSEFTPELKPHVSILPQVSPEVIAAVRDEDQHPVKAQWDHLTDEQTVLTRGLLVLANSPEVANMDPRQAVLIGGLFSYENLYEAAVRQRAEAMEEFEAAELVEEPPREPKIRPFRAIKLGAALMVMSWRQRIRKDIETIDY